jgi:eukaryotic-like serine/threonine-protein kinase
VAREAGEPFVVTEYMPAYSVAELTRALGPLTVPMVAAIGDAVAAGLAAAHQEGITHRDVKPGNVLVGGDGRVKLTDFGIARNVSEKTITRTGIMLGSPCYIAPEVAAGREVTPAADLWGLGATLFAVVEGHPPYDASGAVLETISQVVHGEVPRPSEGPLAEVITGLMVKEPAGRLTLAEVRNRLHPLLPPPSTPLLSAETLRRLDGSIGDESPTGVNAPVGLVEPEPDPPVPTGSAGSSASPAPSSPAPSAPASSAPAAPLAAEPGSVPSSAPGSAASSAPGSAAGSAPGSAADSAAGLAAAPGPLPFTPTRPRRTAGRRGALASAVLALVAVLLFAGAAGGGFALARVVGGEPLLPPDRTRTSTSAPSPEPSSEAELVEWMGDAATVNGAQGGSYLVRAPEDWARFVEERDVDGLTSTRVYLVSPNGTRTLTIERFAGFYPDHDVDEYVRDLANRENVTYEPVNRIETQNIGEGPEQAQQLTYRTRADAEDLAPDDPAARNLNRVTFADLYPLDDDLWVVSVTVPVDQEDTGRRELFERLIPSFEVTG